MDLADLVNSSIHKGKTVSYTAEKKNICSNCDKCKSMKDMIQDYQVEEPGSNEFFWKSPKSPEEIKQLEPGTSIMGDLNWLGWSVIRCWEHPIKN